MTQIKTLNVWDIDDTLFSTKARVGITENGEFVRFLSSAEFTDFRLQENQEFDFSEFRSSKIFRTTATPVSTVLDRAKEIIEFSGPNTRSILLTARSDFDDRDEFLATFKDHGFPIDEVYVERAGNIEKARTPIAKSFIIKKYLKEYDCIRFFDDSIANLNTFMKLKAFHPEKELIAYLIKEGQIMKFGSTLHSQIKIPHSGMTFGRHMMPQIKSDLMPKFLEHLAKNHISHKISKLPAGALKATQSEFNYEKIESMMGRSDMGSKPLVVSKDNYVLDGHHRWLAEYNKDENKKIPVYIIDLPILDLIHMAKQFEGVKYKSVVESVKAIVTEAIAKK